MIRSGMRTLARSFAGDPNGTRFTDEQVDDMLNQANEMFALESRCLFKDETGSIDNTTTTLTLPADFMYEKKVTLAGLRLFPISRDTLEREKVNDDWTDDEGEPRAYIIDPEEARKTLLVYPILPSGEDARTLVMTYYPKPVGMTSDSEEPLNGSALMAQFHIGIVAMAAWLLLNFEASTESGEVKKAAMMSVYQEKQTQAQELFGNTASEPIQAKGGRGRR